MKDFIQAIKILLSREFWKDFREYYSTDNIAKRIDKLSKNIQDGSVRFDDRGVTFIKDGKEQHAIHFDNSEIIEREETNTYTGAFYLSRGAKVISVRTRPMRKKKGNKEGYGTQWVVKYKVKRKYIDQIKNNTATMSVSDMQSYRRRLKRIIKRSL